MWFLYYGRQLGMTRREILSCPIGEMRDYIACREIEHGAKPKEYGTVDDLAAIM